MRKFLRLIAYSILNMHGFKPYGKIWGGRFNMVHALYDYGDVAH